MTVNLVLAFVAPALYLALGVYSFLSYCVWTIAVAGLPTEGAASRLFRMGLHPRSFPRFILCSTLAIPFAALLGLLYTVAFFAITENVQQTLLEKVRSAGRQSYKHVLLDTLMESAIKLYKKPKLTPHEQEELDRLIHRIDCLFNELKK